MKTTIVITGLALVSALSLSSCVVAVGNRVPEPTVGRQLLDLKEARHNGVLTEAEYQAQKTKLLSQKASAQQ